ncbi:unnamed protein product [Rhodiola kirilowii]
MAPPGCEAICGMETFLEKHTDQEADIIDDNGSSSNCSNPTLTTTTALLDTDATECSTSFDTTSDAPNFSGLSDVEVDSTAFHSAFHPRKKKLSKHWRNYICPLMWRCKWTELRMVEVESQGLNYAKELKLYNERKPNQDVLKTLGSKSYPHFRQYPTNKVIKRRKRRKLEDTIDVASYISQHNLFSFIAENRNHGSDSYTTADDVVIAVNTNKKTHSCNQFGIHDAQPLVIGDWNTGIEGIFEKLEKVQSHVHKLKTQLEDVMTEHAAKISSSEDMSIFSPFDGQCSSNHSPTLSMGWTYPPIHSIPSFDIGDFGFPDSAVSRFDETIDMDDIIESPMVVFPVADAPSSHPQIMESDQIIVGDVPVDTSFVELERLSSITTVARQEQQSQEPKNVICLTQSATVPDDVVACHGPSIVESSWGSDFTPKNKRKRGERKVSSGSWIKRYSISDSE